MFISLPGTDCRKLYSFFDGIFGQKEEIKICKEIYDLLSNATLDNYEVFEEDYEKEVANNDLFSDFNMEELEVNSGDTTEQIEAKPLKILKVEHIESEFEETQDLSDDVEETHDPNEESREMPLDVKEEPTDEVNDLDEDYTDDQSTKTNSSQGIKKKRKPKMKLIKGDKEGRCDQCYKTFKNIKTHMLTHEAPQIFYCPKCDFNTPRKYTLIRHERTYKGHMKNGKCRRCQLRVPPHAEADHKCIILCNVCGKTFPTWKILTAHYHEVHGINMIKKAEGRKKIVRCGACKI